MVFGPDGKLYVTEGGKDLEDDGVDDGTIVLCHGATGEFIDYLFPRGGHGISHPTGLVFGPNGKGDGKLDLYVGSGYTDSILRFDGTTGAFVGTFVAKGTGGLMRPAHVVFGPDDNLYVSSLGTKNILRFSGPGAPNPGAFIDEFISAGSGGLETPA